eukprot:scaffold3679_cov116-Isochrysis_galbana.AAC.1
MCCDVEAPCRLHGRWDVCGGCWSQMGVAGGDQGGLSSRARGAGEGGWARRTRVAQEVDECGADGAVHIKNQVGLFAGGQLLHLYQRGGRDSARGAGQGRAQWEWLG